MLVGVPGVVGIDATSEGRCDLYLLGKEKEEASFVQEPAGSGTTRL